MKLIDGKWFIDGKFVFTDKDLHTTKDKILRDHSRATVNDLKIIFSGDSPILKYKRSEYIISGNYK